MKAKDEFSVKIDGELYRKLLFVADKETGGLNNHMLRIIRSSVQYYEKVHGKIDPSSVQTPDEIDTEEKK